MSSIIKMIIINNIFYYKYFIKVLTILFIFNNKFLL